MTEDYTAMDANNVLALGLNRYLSAKRGPDFIESLSGQLDHVYSNGTEHGLAQENADLVMQAAPMLRRVLEAGVRALTGEKEFDSYVLALTSGDSDTVIAIEDRLRGAVLR